MIKLHPLPTVVLNCPYCTVRLDVNGWYMPGMRTLGDLACPECSRRYYGDLPVGHGLYAPMLLERPYGVVHNPLGEEAAWYAEWMERSYAARTSEAPPFNVEELRPVRKPLVLNCLDPIFGHALHKLLNAQHYIDHHPDFDLILIIPRIMRWLVPEGTAAVWMLGGTLSDSGQWNDWLATQIQKQLAPFDTVYLGAAFSHPHGRDYDIERFTGVTPFPLDEWVERWEKPTVTFCWRETRLWAPEERNLPVKQARYARRFLQDSRIIPDQLRRQEQRIIALADALHETMPNLDFAVAGVGDRGSLPNWLLDLRAPSPNDETERDWCARYAESHIVIGVQGSNMMLPSALAGASVSLIPSGRWGSLLQDLLIDHQDARMALLRHLSLPLQTSSEEVARIAAALIREWPFAAVRYNDSDHDVYTRNPHRSGEAFRAIARQLPVLRGEPPLKGGL